MEDGEELLASSVFSWVPVCADLGSLSLTRQKTGSALQSAEVMQEESSG